MRAVARYVLRRWPHVVSLEVTFHRGSYAIYRSYCGSPYQPVSVSGADACGWLPSCVGGSTHTRE